MTKKNGIKITDETIEKAKGALGILLTTHAGAIAQAYVNCENEVSVVLGVKFRQSEGAGETDMIANISFIESKVKVKDSIKTTLDDKQLPLFK